MHHHLNLVGLIITACTNLLVHFSPLSESLVTNMWHHCTQLCQLVFLEQSTQFDHCGNILDVELSAPIALTVLMKQVPLTES